MLENKEISKMTGRGEIESDILIDLVYPKTYEDLWNFVTYASQVLKQFFPELSVPLPTSLWLNWIVQKAWGNHKKPSPVQESLRIDPQ